MAIVTGTFLRFNVDHPLFTKANIRVVHSILMIKLGSSVGARVGLHGPKSRPADFFHSGTRRMWHIHPSIGTPVSPLIHLHCVGGTQHSLLQNPRGELRPLSLSVQWFGLLSWRHPLRHPTHSSMLLSNPIEQLAIAQGGSL